jgi:hypothetical protein
MTTSSIKLSETLVGYHGHCTDGKTAAWSARHFGVPEENLHEVQYGEPLPEVFFAHQGTIAFLDFRPPLADLRKLARSVAGRRVFVVDHHKAAWDEAFEALSADSAGFSTLFTPTTSNTLVELEKEPQLVYIFDNDRSGARLAWDFFQGATYFVQPRPLLIDLVEDYDLWRKKLPLVEEVAIILQSQSLSFSLLDETHDDLCNELGRIEAKGRAFMDMRAGLVEKAVKKIGLVSLGVPGARFPIVCSLQFKNEIAHKLLMQGYEVAVVWHHGPGVAPDGTQIGRCFHSLRSKTVDVAAIAREFGGNGHKNAAGFVTNLPLDLLP